MDTRPAPNMPARLHLLPAREASVVGVLRRKPSRVFHVLRWNTADDTITPGSWFRGKLYPLRCDVSFDGDWLVYLAMGSSGDTWNGVCRLPWLQTVADAPNMGTWHGGGYFAGRQELRLNCWTTEGRPQSTHPFRMETYGNGYGEDEGVLYPRLERDGWAREGEFGRRVRLRNTAKYMVACVDDPGWSWQPTRRHPVLRMFYLGYLEHGRTFKFALDDHPGLLDGVDWATWDARGNLVVARAGGLERYALADLKRGEATFRVSLEDLKAPEKPEPGVNDA